MSFLLCLDVRHGGNVDHSSILDGETTSERVEQEEQKQDRGEAETNTQECDSEGNLKCEHLTPLRTLPLPCIAITASLPGAFDFPTLCC